VEQRVDGADADEGAEIGDFNYLALYDFLDFGVEC
jgi:hypothetical protein